MTLPWIFPRILFAGALALSIGFTAAQVNAEIPRRDPAETFADSCASCHKGDGRGGPGYGGYAANLRITALTAEEIVEILVTGRQDRGMPTFDGVIEPGEMMDVAVFVLTELRDPPEGEETAE